MPAFREEYLKEADDTRRQAVSDWKERVLRVEEPFIKSEEQKEAEEKAHYAECLANFIRMAHDNPEWHLKYLAEELDREMFYLLNRKKYQPSWKDGVPGYWDFRKQHAQEWILETRERLPNE